MRRLLFSSVVLLTTCHAANAQIFSVKAGLNLAYLKTSDEMKTDMKPGFHAGVMAEFPLNQRFALETGLLINERGGKSKFNDVSNESKFSTNLYYLDAPLLAKFYQPVGKKARMFISAGPYVALGILGLSRSKVTTNGTTEKNVDNIHWWKEGSPFKKIEVGSSLGLGVTSGKMQYGAYYDIGLTSFFKFDADEWSSKNRVLRFSVGYRLGKDRG